MIMGKRWKERFEDFHWTSCRTNLFHTQCPFQEVLGFLWYFYGDGFGWRIVLSASLQVQEVGECWKRDESDWALEDCGQHLFFPVLELDLSHNISKASNEHTSQIMESCWFEAWTSHQEQQNWKIKDTSLCLTLISCCFQISLVWAQRCSSFAFCFWCCAHHTCGALWTKACSLLGIGIGSRPSARFILETNKQSVLHPLPFCLS